jgi:hypothetical protein
MFYTIEDVKVEDIQRYKKADRVIIFSAIMGILNGINIIITLIVFVKCYFERRYVFAKYLRNYKYISWTLLLILGILKRQQMCKIGIYRDRNCTLMENIKGMWVMLLFSPIDLYFIYIIHSYYVRGICNQIGPDDNIIFSEVASSHHV